MDRNFQAILTDVEGYYTGKVEKYGATAQGVDWNSPESQALRFEQLLKVADLSRPFSLNDYGCGYGALTEYLTARRYDFQYYGFDISAQMVAEAERVNGLGGRCLFFSDEARLRPADYTVASGIFNVKLQTSEEEWERYVLHTLAKLCDLSVRGFAFNVLTKYSDRERMRPDLYYADPLFLFDYCKRHFSKYVALLHDYPLYEFTVLIRKA